MSSYIILELDTTPPEIEIYTPSYTTTELFNEITIISNNDILSEYQEIYVVDSNGNKHDYTFQKKNKHEYIGIVRFSLFPIGMATIYARMMDDVGNMSNVVSKSFEIKESLTLLTLDINDRQLNTYISDNSINIESHDKVRNITILDNDRSDISGNK